MSEAAVVKELPRAVGLPLHLVGGLYLVGIPFAFMLPWTYYVPYVWGLLLVFMVQDWATSNRYELNKQVLLKNGFTEKEMVEGVWGTFATGPLTQLLGAWLVAPACKDLGELWDVVSNWEWDVVLGAKVAAAVACMELTFTVAHTYMHRKRPEMHLMHHCVRYPSWPLGSMVFDQTDLLIEFTGLIVIPMIGGWLFSDPAMMVCTFAVSNCFADLGHSQYIRLAHYYHHAYIAGNYHFFLQGRTPDAEDKLRALIKS